MADGSFGIIYTKKETDILDNTVKKRKVACRFIIEQRIICPHSNESYEQIMGTIATFLSVNLNVVNRTSGKQYFNVTAKSRESLRILKNYFNTHFPKTVHFYYTVYHKPHVFPPSIQTCEPAYLKRHICI